MKNVCPTPLGQPDVPVPDFEPVCPGQVVTFTIPPVLGATFYNWNFPPGVIPLSIDCNTATVIWGSSPGNTTVTASSDINPIGLTSDPHFMEVYFPEGFDGGEYCFPDDPGWTHPGTGSIWPAGTFDLVIPMGAANGCDSTVHLTIIEHSSPPVLIFEQICPDGETCEIGAVPGQPGVILTGTTNGLTYTITDGSLYGCDSTMIINVEVIDPNVQITQPDTLNCFTEAAGGVPILSDFYPGATYLWTAGPGGMIEGADDQNLIFVSQPGWYYLYLQFEGTVSDACLFPPICIELDSVQVFSNFEEPQTAISGTNLSCGSGTDGTATVTATAGVPPYTYQWSSQTNDTLAMADNLVAGSYTVTVTGSNGCTSIETINLTEPAAVELSIIDTTAASCFGTATGGITVTTVGGTTPYTYTWSHDGTLNNPTASSLDAGSYNIISTDANGCADTIDVFLSQPVNFSIDLVDTDVACNGAATGTATITLTGGTPPYTYSWPAGSGQSGNSSTNLAAGIYLVTIADENGCSEFVNIDIMQPAEITLSEAHQDVDCNGNNTGSLTITASGGTGAYTYSLGGAAGVSTETFGSLQSGSYTVEVTDENGCTEMISVMIDEPAVISLSSVETEATCNGDTDGTTTVTVNGGTSPYTYSINGAPAGGNNIFNGLAAGAHTVEVVDAMGCSEIINLSIDEPTEIMTSSVEGDATCNGTPDGTSTVTASGGTMPYMYSINGAPAGGSNIFNGLAAGAHTIEVIDARGCSEIINIAVSQPSIITVLSSETGASCNGELDGMSTISASGGTAPYTYGLDGAPAVPGASFSGLAPGPHTIDVIDANGCVGSIMINIDQPAAIMTSSIESPASCNGVSDGSTTITASGGTPPLQYGIDAGPLGAATNFGSLSSGLHTIEVVDGNGCTTSFNITITEPTAIQVSSLESPTACNGDTNGSTTITATGGTAPYTYSIDAGPAGGSSVFNGLAAGMHTVEIFDANGCSEIVDIDISEPTAIQVSSLELDASCNGVADGSTTITASGGTAPLMYSLNSAPAIGSPTFGSLPAGPHVLEIIDANGCTEVLNISIAEPMPISLSSVEAAVNCNGGTDGETSITASGGTPPFSYAIDGGTASPSPDFPGLAAGPHTVVVTDGNGCSETIQLNIAEPTALSLIASGTDALCFNGDEGTAMATAAGGTAPYTYDIGNGPVPSPDFSTLGANDYTITVIDANGCSTTTNITIGQPAELIASAASLETSCAGGSDGTVTGSAVGGTTPYMYSVDGGAPNANPSFMGQSDGPHTIEVIDANGCTSTTMVDVGSPTAITLQIDGTDALCFGEGSGTSTVTAIGGTGVYTYLWSDGLGQITPLAELLMAGTYTVTVTDERGCTETIDYVIAEPVAALNATTASTDATCGSSNGTITLSPSGGTAPYTYIWSNMTTTQNQNSLLPGNFAYTVTDANGCEFVGGETVDTPSGLGATELTTAASCNGGADGTITLTINGGSLPYVIDWSDPTYNGQTALTGLPSGPYTVTITDDDGCSITSSQTVMEPAALELTLTPVQASCGLSDGSINVLITGGTQNSSGSYSFDWNENTLDNIEDPTGIPQGTYTLIVIDDNGCSIEATTDVTVPNPPALSFTQQNIACNSESTGSVTVDVVGGEAPYTYDWSDDNYDGVEDPIAMAAGTYTLVVTDSKNCSDVITVNLTEPTPIEITQISSTDATCGSANGTITTTVQGGTGAYTYDWSVDPLDGTANPNNLIPGNYSVTVSDANGCTASTNVSVVTPNGLELVVAFNDASCNGGSDGSIDLTINGGSGPFDIDWTGTVFDGIEDPSGLAIGVYDVIVTDATACEVSASVTISEPTPISIVGTVIDASCLANDGGVNLTVTGGTPDVSGGYSYVWDNGAGTTQDPVGLAPNTYGVTVTDDNGCSAEFSADVTIPNAPTIQFLSTDAQCNGASDGTIAITVDGGASPYTYAWDNPILSGDNPTTVPAGTYTLLVTDVNNCEVTETIVIAEPAALSATGTTVQATCGSANGSIDITVMGGTMPYSYTWSGSAGSNEDPTALVPGSYIVTITDDQGCELIETFSVSTPNQLEASSDFVPVSCNGGDDGSIDITVTGGTTPYTYLWTNSSIDEDISGLAADTYTLAITDGDGCVISVSVNVPEPTAIQLSTQSFDATCNQSNGSIDLTVTGGTMPYLFEWDGGAGNNEDPQNLLSGNYNVTVTDDNGCTALFGETVESPNGVVLSSTTDDVNCNGGADGSINVGISGGIGTISNFIITWSDPTIGDTPTPTGLEAGTYTITVTDEAGCNFSETLTIDEPPLLEAFIVGPTGVSCNSGNDGSIDLGVAGGVMPYVFAWDNSAGNNEDPDNLAAGTYNVTVTDDNGCTAVTTAEIVEPAALELSLASTDADCFGSSDGTLGSTVTGGTQPYSYLWDNNVGTDANPTDIPAGIYQLVVTDAEGCTIASSISVAQPAMIEISITDESNNNGFNISCSDAADGYVSVSAAGGNPPFSYAWSTGANGTSIDNQTAGTYIVIVTDAKGCSETLAVTLTAPEALDISVQAVPPICFEDGNGFIFVEQVNGGTGPYIYSIDNQPFSSNPSFTNLHGGDYQLNIQDANGCAWTEDIRIIEPQELTVDIGDNFEMEFGGDDEILVPVPNTDPINIVDWAWLSGTTCDTCYNLSINPVEATIFEFMIEDVNGCIATDQLTVQVRKDRLVYIPNAFSPNGDGVNDKFLVYGGKGVEKVESFLVFDRWGEIVYKVDTEFDPGNPDYGWDGTLKSEKLNPGVFVYVAQVRFLDGEVIMYKGDVTLMSGAN